MLANRLGTRDGGGWMLPVWREMGGQQACNAHPELHGAAGVLLSDDQAGCQLRHCLYRPQCKPYQNATEDIRDNQWQSLVKL